MSKTEIIYRSVKKKDISIYVGINKFSITWEWPNQKYPSLVILFPLNMTYFQLYGREIKSLNNNI